MKIQLEHESLDFSAQSGEDGALYAFHLDFFSPIRREQSKWSTQRCPVFFLSKTTEDTWPKLQKGGKLPWVKIDWSRWADSDDEDEKGAFDTLDMQGMDFSAMTEQDVEGSDDGDSILADLDEDVAITTDDEMQAQK